MNIKHTKQDKRSSENGEKIFGKRIQKVSIVECKKFKNWEEEVLKQGKRNSYTQIKSFERYIQDVLKVLIKNTQSEIKEVHKIYSVRGFKKFLWWN